MYLIVQLCPCTIFIFFFLLLALFIVNKPMTPKQYKVTNLHRFFRLVVCSTSHGSCRRGLLIGQYICVDTRHYPGYTSLQNKYTTHVTFNIVTTNNIRLINIQNTTKNSFSILKDWTPIYEFVMLKDRLATTHMNVV